VRNSYKLNLAGYKKIIAKKIARKEQEKQRKLAAEHQRGVGRLIAVMQKDNLFFKNEKGVTKEAEQGVKDRGGKPIEDTRLHEEDEVREGGRQGGVHSKVFHSTPQNSSKIAANISLQPHTNPIPSHPTPPTVLRSHQQNHCGTQTPPVPVGQLNSKRSARPPQSRARARLPCRPPLRPRDSSRRLGLLEGEHT